ncbi:hypothetical protein ABI59_09030 [Acidobacteria bacterium Mor1]|nr:hypothetical protein ABI59_09030 [Acidobacteria bacterium Mor1]
MVSVSRISAVLAVLFVLFSGCGVPPAAAHAEAVGSRAVDSDASGIHAAYRSIRDASPQLEAARIADGLTLPLGNARLDILRGHLFQVPATDSSMELLFLGEARLRLQTADPVEAGQLALFTGDEALDETISQAALVVGDREVLERLRALEQQPSPGKLAATAAELFARWRDSPERRRIDATGGMLLNATRANGAESDPRPAFTAAWLGSPRLGPFVLSVDPLAHEQVKIEHFTPLLAPSEKERRAREREIESRQRKGHMLGVGLGDLGQWSTWYSAALAGGDGTPAPGSSGYESIHYSLDTQIDNNFRDLAGEATIRLRALPGVGRVVRLQASADLIYDSIRDGAGNALFHRKARNHTQVFLEKAPAPGQTLELQAAFHGAMLDRDQGILFLRDTVHWYPHAGDIDRATYDARFEWPRKLQLVASGEVVEQGEAPGRRRWQLRKLDRPSAAFSFEIGDFVIDTLQVGHIEVELAFNRKGARIPEKIREDFHDSLRTSLTLYEEQFGPYPLDRLTVVTAARSFSQGLLGFVTLSRSLLEDFGTFQVLSGVQDRGSVVAHEIAHQWWGNVIGWRSYRDEWISEAMANYAAMLWGRSVAQDPRMFSGPIRDWQSILTELTPDGRPVESLGPLTLGRRLNSRLWPTAYGAVVYKKGAVVLNTLSQFVGEEQFLKSLRDLTANRAFESISTEDFIAHLEAHTGIDLEPFAERMIYGTGLPEVYYSYEFVEEPGGAWRVVGTAEQQAPYRYAVRAVPLDDGRYDMRREMVSQEAASVPVIAPVEVVVDAGGDGESRVAGKLVMSDPVYRFDLPLDHPPRSFWLDRERAVFGRFYSAEQSPKRTALRRAQSLLAEGDNAAAEELFRSVFEQPVHPGAPKTNLEAQVLWLEGRILDAGAHTNLAWLYLDQGRIDEAGEALQAAEEQISFGGRRRYRSRLSTINTMLDWRSGTSPRARRAMQGVGSSLNDAIVETIRAGQARAYETSQVGRSLGILRARYEVLSGKPDVAHRRLKQWKDDGILRSADGYLLLAITSDMLGEGKLALEALQAAEARGADVSALQRFEINGTQ